MYRSESCPRKVVISANFSFIVVQVLIFLLFSLRLMPYFPLALNHIFILTQDLSRSKRDKIYQGANLNVFKVFEGAKT
jgi:hypothetical protein